MVTRPFVTVERPWTAKETTADGWAGGNLSFVVNLLVNIEGGLRAGGG
jgi:hypothetical protein